MRKSLTLLVIIVMPLLDGCHSISQRRVAENPLSEAEISSPGTVNMTNIPLDAKPDDIIRILRESGSENKVIFVKERWVADWKLSDLINIVKLVYSKEPATYVYSTASSIRIPKEMFKGSTVGQEARFIILGYMTLRYPPRLTSSDVSRESENMVMQFASDLRDIEKGISVNGVQGEPEPGDLTKENKGKETEKQSDSEQTAGAKIQ